MQLLVTSIKHFSLSARSIFSCSIRCFQMEN